ncbi:MAG: O-antigen ligase family protein [Negativicutes bacterium]|nr:O-antigen ligase family protein [Negativicutes bacterium]
MISKLKNLTIINKFGYFFIVLFVLANHLSTSLMWVSIISMIILAAYKFFRYKEDIVPPEPIIVKGMAVFIFCMVISSAFSNDQVKSLNVAFDFFEVMLPFFLPFLFVKTRRQLIIVILALGLAVSIPSVHAIYQGIHGNFRAGSFFSNPMFLGGLLSISIPFYYVLALEKDYLCNNKVRLFCGAVAALAAIALVYNGTRGVWVAVVVVLVLHLLSVFFRNPKLGIVLTIIFCVLSGMLWQTSTIQNRIKSITSIKNKSNMERFLIWESSIKMAKDYPITGVGLGNFNKFEMERYISPKSKGPKSHVHAHNNLLHFLAETGIIGFGGFIIMYYSIFRAFMMRQRHTIMKAGLLVTLSFLIYGMTEFNFGHREVMRIYWFILGLAFCLQKNNSMFGEDQLK